MNYTSLKKEILEAMPLNGYTKYKDSYYRVIDGCILLCIGLRHENHSVGIHFKIWPFVKGRAYELFDIKRGFIGFNATLVYCHKYGIDAFDGLKTLYIDPPIDNKEEHCLRLIEFARAVFSDILNVFNEVKTIEDCISAMLGFFPYNEKYWAIPPSEAATICIMLVLCRKEEKILEYMEEYLKHMEREHDNEMREFMVSTFYLYIDPCLCAVLNNDYIALYNLFAKKYIEFCEKLKTTKLALPDEDIKSFLDSISWMKE